MLAYIHHVHHYRKYKVGFRAQEETLHPVHSRKRNPIITYQACRGRPRLCSVGVRGLAREARFFDIKEFRNGRERVIRDIHFFLLNTAISRSLALRTALHTRSIDSESSGVAGPDELVEAWEAKGVENGSGAMGRFRGGWRLSDSLSSPEL